jgi:hypothetical protein
MPNISQSDGSIKFSAIAARFGKSSTSSGITLSNYYRNGARVPNITDNSLVPVSGAIRVSDLTNAVRKKDSYLIVPWGMSSNFENNVSTDGDIIDRFPGFILGLHRNLGNPRNRCVNSSIAFANGGTTGLTQVLGIQEIDQNQSSSYFVGAGAAPTFFARPNSQFTFGHSASTGTTSITSSTLGTTTFSTTTGLAVSTDPSLLGTGDNNDGTWNITLPWTYRLGSVDYAYVNISTNSLVALTTTTQGTTGILYDPMVYGFSYEGIVVSGADNSCQRIYYGTTGTAPNRIYKIIWEGTNTQTGTVGSPNIKWELQLYENTGATHTGAIARLLVGVNSRGIVNDLPNYTGTNRYGTWQLTPPWSVEFMGRSMDTIYVHSKSFMEFRNSIPSSDYWDYKLGTGPTGYSGIGSKGPALNTKSLFQSQMPKFGIGIIPFDNRAFESARPLTPDTNNYVMSCERVWAGVSGTAPNRTYRIRFEGTVQSSTYNTEPSTLGIPGTPNLTWEARFFENAAAKIDIHFSSSSVKLPGFYNYKLLTFDELGKNVPNGPTANAVGNLTHYNLTTQVLGGTSETGFVYTAAGTGRALTSVAANGTRYIPEPRIEYGLGYTLPENYKSIASSCASVLAVGSDGGLYYWGMDPSIDLSNGSTSHYIILEDYKVFSEDTDYLQYYKLSPTRIGTDSDWKKVIPAGSRAGGFMILKNDGTLYVLGHINDSRLLGGSSFTGPRGIGVNTAYRQTSPLFKDYTLASTTFVATSITTSKNITVSNDGQSFWKFYLDFNITYGNAVPTNLIRICSILGTDNTSSNTYILINDEVIEITNYSPVEVYAVLSGSPPSRVVTLTLLLSGTYGPWAGIVNTNATNDTITIATYSLSQTINVGDSFKVTTSVGGLAVGTRYFVRSVSAPVLDPNNSVYYNVTCTLSTNPGGTAFNITTNETFDPYNSTGQYLDSWLNGCVQLRFSEAGSPSLDFHVITMGRNTRDYFGDHQVRFGRFLADMETTPTTQTADPYSSTDVNALWWNIVYSPTRSTDTAGRLDNNTAFRINKSAIVDVYSGIDRQIHFPTVTRLFSGFSVGFKDISFTAESKYPNYQTTTGFFFDRASSYGYGFIGHAFYGIGLDNNLYAAGDFRYATSTTITNTNSGASTVLNNSNSLMNSLSVDSAPTVRGGGSADWDYIDGCDGVWTALKTSGQLHSWGNELARGYSYTSGGFKGPSTTTTIQPYRFGALARGETANLNDIMSENVASLSTVKFVKALNRRRVGVGLSVDGGVYTWGSTQSSGSNNATDSRQRLGTYNTQDAANTRRFTPLPLWADVSVTSASAGLFSFNWITGVSQRITVAVGAPIVFSDRFNGAVTVDQVYYITYWVPTTIGGTFRVSTQRGGLGALAVTFSLGSVDPLRVTARAGLFRCMDIWSDGEAYHALDQDASTIYTWGTQTYTTLNSNSSMSVQIGGLAIYAPESNSINTHFNQAFKHYYLRS